MYILIVRPHNLDVLERHEVVYKKYFKFIMNNSHEIIEKINSLPRNVKMKYLKTEILAA